MLDDVAKALGQMLSSPLRAILWKAIGLALAVIVVVAIALDRLIVWLLGAGTASLEHGIGPQAHTPVTAIAWLLSFAAGFGVIVGGIFLMPAVTALVGSFFADQIADEVERANYPADPPGAALPLGVAVPEGAKTALLAIVVYVFAVPFLLFAGFGALLFFVATAWLLGREYFKLAALRFHSPPQARLLRQRHAGTVFVGGLMIAAFVSLPVINLATPLFAMSLMVHVHKRLGGKTSVANSGRQNN
jgi:CysZ protein